MGKNLYHRTPDELLVEINKEKAAEQKLRFMGNEKQANRHAARAAQLGKVRSEVLTAPLPFESLATRHAAPGAACRPPAPELAPLDEPGGNAEPDADTGAETDGEQRERRTADTSIEALLPSRAWAKGLRKLCLKVLLNNGAMTADEAALKLGKSPFAIRPRFSELLTIGAIKDTGERRRGPSGKRSIVWAPL